MRDALGKAFHNMLIDLGIEDRILAFTGDNATSNDTQSSKLDELPNSFEEANRVQCFNHTLNLMVKSILKLFNHKTKDQGASSEPSDENDDDELPDLLSDSDDSDDDGDDEGESWDLSNLDDPEEVDELEELDVAEKSILLADTAAVRSTLVKVSACLRCIRLCVYPVLDSSGVSLMQLYTLRPSHYPRGIEHARLTESRAASSLAMLLRDGTSPTL
ncbi:hypothetical protein BKA93DRAFT_743456 [Sparassis latifolia]